MAEQSRELSTGKGQVDPSDSPHTPCPGVEEMDQWVKHEAEFGSPALVLKASAVVFAPITQALGVRADIPRRLPGWLA